MSEKIEEALKMYLDRKKGIRRPSGEMIIRGSKGRFILDKNEVFSCCLSVTECMRWSHAYSVKHIATMFGISTNSLNARIRKEHKK